MKLLTIFSATGRPAAALPAGKVWQDGPRQGDRGLGEVGERQGLGDLIPYELVLISGNRHQRQNGHDPDDDHHFNEVKPQVRMAGDESTPPLARMKIRYYPALNPVEIEQKWRGFWSGVDIGGTFTDCVALDRDGRDEIFFHPANFGRRACSPRCAVAIERHTVR